MLYVILALATLFLVVVAMMLLGKVPAKPVGALAGIIGVTGSILILWMVGTDALAAFGPTVTVAAGVGAFGFFMVYLLIAGEVFVGGDFKATGWCCLPVAIFVTLIGLGFWNVLGTALPLVGQFGLMFIVYAGAFFLIWLVFAMGMSNLSKLLAWYLLIPVVVITVGWPIFMFINYGVVGRWFP